jgi:histidyl-tRNA synthetase
MLGGPDIPATGFAIGFDRLADIVELKKADLVRSPDLYVAALGEKSRDMAFNWTCRLGEQGLLASMDFEGRSLKSQMKRANKLKAGYTLIVGDNEIEKGAAILRNMESKEQKPVPLNDLPATILRLITDR